MSATPQDWFEEATRRAEDAAVLHERGRNARAVSASYFAVFVAGKGLLLTVGVRIDSHKALRVYLGKEFIRHGQLPSDTAAFIDDLYKRRLQADYELETVSSSDVSRTLSRVRNLIRKLSSIR
jgi:uncharacterized protein (UPF0332 family)